MYINIYIYIITIILYNNMDNLYVTYMKRKIHKEKAKRINHNDVV